MIRATTQPAGDQLDRKANKVRVINPLLSSVPDALHDQSLMVLCTFNAGADKVRRLENAAGRLLRFLRNSDDWLPPQPYLFM